MDLIPYESKEKEGVIQFKQDRYAYTAPEIQKRFEILYVLSGSAKAEVGRKKIRLQKNDLILINAWEFRRIEEQQELCTLSLLIDTRREGQPDQRICYNFFDSRQEETVQKIRIFFGTLFELYYKDVQKSQREICKLGEQLLVFLKDNMETETREEPDDYQVVMERILSEIHERYMDPLTLQEVAGAYFLSKATLSRWFQRLVRKSFREYVKGVRLKRAEQKLRQSPEKSVTEISRECGFSTVTMMISAFRVMYGITPKKWRTKQSTLSDRNSQNLAMFQEILQYADPRIVASVGKPSTIWVRSDCLAEGGREKTTYFELMNVGWARDLMMESVRNIIRNVQKEVGFHYLRCHGIFDDDMMVCSESDAGESCYYFGYIDQIYDFLLSVGLTPYVEFSYMPSALASSEDTWYWKKAHICMPKNMAKWNRLVRAFLVHCIERYGIEHVQTWKFTVLQGIGVYFGCFSADEFFSLYANTYRVVKGVDASLQMGGPGVDISMDYTNDQGGFLRRFISFGRKNGCMPDFICLEFYHVLFEKDSRQIRSRLDSHYTEPLTIVQNENYLQEVTEFIQRLQNEEKIRKIPVYLECWNSTVWQHDLNNDTCYKAAFLMKNLLEQGNRYSGMGYWNLCDQFEEVFPSNDLFHGGYGMVLSNGIPKSALNVYKLLRKVGDYRLNQGNGYVITKSSNEEIQVCLYNYCHYDSLSRHRLFFRGSHTDRYEGFEHAVPNLYRIELKVCPGNYRVESYLISRKPIAGSSYDAWVAMGAPKQMTVEQTEYLRCCSGPSCHTAEYSAKDGVIRLEYMLETHSVCLLVLQKTG